MTNIKLDIPLLTKDDNLRYKLPKVLKSLK